MAVKFLDKTGLGYFWGKIKTWCNSTFAAIAHTHTSYAVKHSYTTAANQAKAWLRIANANTHQMDTSKPLHVQFLLTAWNPDQPADYYEQWFIDCQVFGRNSGIRIFGASSAPFSQARVLYENTVADIDTNDRPAIDIYLNYVLTTACHVEIQEVYNSGWTFLTNGVLAASTISTGFENRAVSSQGSGVHQATYASYGTYTTLQRSNITANITLADNDTYRMRVLNCTKAITVTVPSLNSAYAWFLIKNFNATSTTNNVTIHPSTTSVKIDDSNADIILKPGEWVIIASKAANSYSLIGDGRWKSQKADKATTLAGYGITDAKIANGTITLGSNSITPLTSHQTLPTLSRTISGSGNAITDITVSNHTITATKGSTFLTSASTLDATKLSGTIPSGCYTDTTYTAGTGLSLNGTQFSLASHNQASNTVNLLTGYSKPSTSSALAATDTLNQALGKLEAKVDAVDQSNVVHRTNDESITGKKSFRDNIIRQNMDTTRGTVPSESLYSEIQFIDSTGTVWSDDGNHGRFAAIQSIQSNDGYNQLCLYAYPNVRNSNKTCSLQLKMSQGGYRYLDAYGSMHITDNSPYLELYDSNSRRTGGDNHPTLGIGFNDRVGDGYCDILFHDYGDGDDRPALSFYINSPWTSDSTTHSIHFHWRRSDQYIWFGPGSNNTISLGSSYNLWKQLFASTTTISTSDKRFKDDINLVNEDLLDNWDNVEWVNFKFKDAIKEKGINKARIHTGLIAQDIQDTFNSVGIDITKYGFFCFDEWDALDEVYDEKRKLKLNDAVEADYRYAIRYEEALCIEAAYQRRKNKILESRISELEKQVSDMLQILQNLTSNNG